MSTQPQHPAQEALTLVDGEWQRECGCKVHYFDGKPWELNLTELGTTHLEGKVAPHIHLYGGLTPLPMTRCSVLIA